MGNHQHLAAEALQGGGEENARLRGEVARLSAERDALLHLVLRSNRTSLGRLGQRWAAFEERHAWAERWIGRSARLLRLLLTLRWPGGLRVNPLFDEAWYRERYADAPAGRRAAYRQYRRSSLPEGRDPNPDFDTDWYLDRNPDVRVGHWHPLDHYLLFGWLEARDPSAHFDGFDYLRHHPDCVARAMNPLQHRLEQDARRLAQGTLPPLPGPPPLLRRTMTHYQRHGARRTISRATAELGLAGRALTVLDQKQAPVVPEVDARRIKAHLDTPRSGAIEAASTLLVSGWAFSSVSVVSAEVYLDGSLAVLADLHQPRPDVAAFHGGQPEAERSGFSARVPLDGVTADGHGIQVVIRTDDGATRVLSAAFQRVEPSISYHHYYGRSLPTAAEQARLRQRARAGELPAIHLVVEAGDPEDVRRTLRSVREQGYPGLSGSILASAERAADAAEVLASFAPAAPESAWSVVTRADESLPPATAGARFVGLLRAGEILAPAALLQVADEQGSGDAALIYSDHDGVEETGRHVDPWFVPDWSPDHLLAQDYIGGFYLARDSELLRESLAALADARTSRARTPAWRYDLLLRLTDRPGRVVHIPRVLWSRPTDPAAHPAADPATSEAELAAVRAALDRRATGAAVESLPGAAHAPLRHISWPLERPPRVSIIVPTTGRPELVERLIESLEQRTDYPERELIVLDNSRGLHPDGIAFLEGHGATILERDEAFNWARLNDAGAQVATGELLLFLNDDIEATDPGWLTALVRQATRSDIGAVGPLLQYPDGTIQHAGVFLVGHGGGAVHLFRGIDPADDPYLDLHRVAREVTALTGACLLVPRNVFDQVGGFDEDLAIIGNDVDLCLRIARSGRRVLLEPRSTLIHHESQSRLEVDHLPDEGRMWTRWATVFRDGDPHYNPNLTQEGADAQVEWDRVADRPDPMAQADPATGVNLVGYIRAEMGVGEAARSDARALTAAGVPFVILDHELGTQARLADGSWLHALVEAPVFDTNILHINADLLPQALRQLPAGLLEGRRNIGYWTWELAAFPARWRGSFALVDEVWVPSTFVQRAIGADAPVPVRVVPHSLRSPRGPFLGREHFGLREDGFQVLAMYDTQSVFERKNPAGAIEAFVRAFGDDQGTRLVLKVNSAGERELTILRRSIADRPNIVLLTQVLARHEVDSLMACSDAFLSLHRAEGFGLPIAEAMALGKAVVATGWSGNMDLMREENAACVRYELVTLERSHGPYEAWQQWAEPDLDDAAAWLRRLRVDEALRSTLGAAAAETMATRYSASAVGAIIVEHLERRAVARVA